MVDGVNIEPLLKAYSKFEQFRSVLVSEKDKAATIQSYEYCFELAWKTMQRLLEIRGKQAYSPRDVFRMAALAGFIQEPELWFDFLKMRNLTVHTYNEDTADDVLGILPQFSKEIAQLLDKIQYNKL